MKKLLIIPMFLLASSIIYVQASTYEEQAREEMQTQEQFKACQNKTKRTACSYDVIKKVSCDPILIGGALNPCTVTEKGGKKQGVCKEEPSAGGASTDYVLICK